MRWSRIVVFLGVLAIATPVMAQQSGVPCWCQINVDRNLVAGQFMPSAGAFMSVNPYYAGNAPDGTRFFRGRTITSVIDISAARGYSPRWDGGSSSPACVACILTDE